MKSLKRVERDLAERFPASEIEIERVAIVSVIGRNLTAPGLTLRALQALSEAGIAPLGMQDLTRRVDLQFVIDDKDYDGTLRTLHAALVESDIEAMGQDAPGSETGLRDAA